MKSKLKKSLSLLLALVMAMSCMSLGAMADPLADENGAVASVTIGDQTKYYADLHEALDAALNTAGANNATVNILQDITYEDGATWTPVVFNQAHTLTINGGNKTITKLPDMMFDKQGSGGHHLIMSDLTFESPKATTTIQNGCAVIMGYADSVNELTFTNIRVNNASVTSTKYAAIFVGTYGGYNNNNDGPVWGHVTFTNCKVTNCQVNGGGSTGALMGHAAWNPNSKVVVTGTIVTGNQMTAPAGKACGILFGRLGCAGDTNPDHPDAGVYVEATESGNTVNGTTGYIFGDMGQAGGSGYFTAGGSYSVNPLLTKDKDSRQDAFIKAFDENYDAVQLPDNTWTIALKAAEPDYVAQIGSTGYETLAEAVAAAQNGDTITLLADVANGGGVQVSGTRTIVIDLNGHTYTVDNTAVGSTGTQTQGFQLLKGNNVTIKNGKINLSKDARKNGIQILFNVYCDFTLDDVDVDVTGCDDFRETSSIRFNNGNITITNGTTVEASEGVDAISMFWWPSGGYTDGAQLTIDSDVNLECGILFGCYDAPYAPTGSYATADGWKNTVTLDGTVSKIELTGMDDVEEAAAVLAKAIKSASNTVGAPEGYEWTGPSGGYYTLAPVAETFVGMTDEQILANDDVKNAAENTVVEFTPTASEEVKSNTTYAAEKTTVNNETVVTKYEVKVADTAPVEKAVVTTAQVSSVKTDSVIAKAKYANVITTGGNNTIELFVKADDSNTSSASDTITYEVDPYAIVNGDTSKPVELSNSDLSSNASFTFKVAAPEGATVVDVTHSWDADETRSAGSETFKNQPVVNGQVEVTLTHFSGLEVTTVSTGAAYSGNAWETNFVNYNFGNAQDSLYMNVVLWINTNQGGTDQVGVSTGKIKAQFMNLNAESDYLDQLPSYGDSDTDTAALDAASATALAANGYYFYKSGSYYVVRFKVFPYQISETISVQVYDGNTQKALYENRGSRPSGSDWSGVKLYSLSGNSYSVSMRTWLESFSSTDSDYSIAVAVLNYGTVAESIWDKYGNKKS